MKRRVKVALVRLIVVAVFLAAWQFLPHVEAVSRQFKFMDPYFISSPERIFNALIDWFTGRNGSAVIYPYIWPTLGAALLGAVIGITSGALVGAILSTSSKFVADVVEPILVAINMVPRIALIPIFVILFGPTFMASLVGSIMSVFFIVFFNAYEGGRSVPVHLIENARIMGASSWQVTRTVRLPVVLGWTMAALPPAITFALLSVIATEILTGFRGLGSLITIATIQVDSTLTFAVVVVTAALGLTIVGAAQILKSRALHWWAAS